MIVDDLGPAALVAAGVGVVLAVRARGDRWLAAAVIAGLAAAVPTSRMVAPVALVALAIALGLAVAAAARAAVMLTTTTAAAEAQGAIRPWALAIGLAAVIVVPPLWRSASTAADRDRARVSSYAAAPWKSSPATGR
jgi:hypothetical protein